MRNVSGLRFILDCFRIVCISGLMSFGVVSISLFVMGSPLADFWERDFLIVLIITYAVIQSVYWFLTLVVELIDYPKQTTQHQNKHDSVSRHSQEGICVSCLSHCLIKPVITRLCNEYCGQDDNHGYQPVSHTSTPKEEYYDAV